jgi:hypothetical protein|tara:strand:- start:2078 stop:2455 length:378 start_codon:yes stop_codon:yes gene_type:complete
MTWKEVLKLDRAKLKRRRKKELESIDELTQLPEEDRAYMRRASSSDIAAEEMSHRDARREKRRRTGLLTDYRQPFGTPRKNRPHRMKEEDKPKPRRRATEEELRELTRRNKPPKMGSKGSGFRGH